MTTFVPNQEFTQLASEEQLSKTVKALETNGIRTVVFQTGEEARAYVLDLIPSSVEVYDSPSQTLELIGLVEDIEHATRFGSVRTRLHSLDRATQRREIRGLSASPDVLVGSVHAITEKGEVLLASATGSQLGPAAAGAGTGDLGGRDAKARAHPGGWISSYSRIQPPIRERAHAAGIWSDQCHQ